MFIYDYVNNTRNVTQCNAQVQSTCRNHIKRQHQNNQKDVIINACTMFACFLCILLMLCNDIHPNPGPTNNKSPLLSIVHNNIKSLRNKRDYIYAELNRFDIITISETWFSDNDKQENVQILGYNEPVRRDRPDNSAYGGVAIYVKNHLICKPRPDLAVQGLEAVWVETKLNQDTLLIGCFYRAPDMNVRYWDLIEESISKAYRTPHKFIVIGDFNADCTVRPPPHLQRIMNMNNLHQLVSDPTRYEDETSTMIDLILTPSPDIIHKVGVLPSIQSDHCAPYLEITNSGSTCHTLTFKRKLYNYNKIDENKYIDLLQRVDWNDIITTLSLDEAAAKFSERIMNAVDQCVPNKIVSIRENDEPWFTNDIRTLCEKKLKIHTLAKRLNSVWCWNLFKRIRNELTDVIRDRKQEYKLELEKRVNDKSNFGNKEWWKLVNRFSAKKRQFTIRNTTTPNR